MNLRRIESFIAVAELRSFSAAGIKLHRSPAAISTHIQQLETELGVPLFDRTTRQVAMTTEGQLFYTRCQTVVRELMEVSRELGERSELRGGHVSIGTVPSISSLKLPSVLGEFKSKYPNITLELHEGPINQIHRDLSERVTDFAVAPLHEDSYDLDHQAIVNDPFVAILPRAMTTNRKYITLKALNQIDLLALSHDTAVRATVELVFRNAGLRYRPKIELTHHQTVISMVEAGLGAAILPTICVPKEENADYQVLPIRPGVLTRQICIVTVNGKRLSPAAQACANQIVQALRESA
ncbi:LysR family transcriptional regulator [Bordetella tumbae]|uniref:LysR family transcriptional regulator n=1 Tax=Bordetella tumbae TaxID=1649139 RepID=UPI0039EF0A71